ncbi:MAG: hypothetical protein ACRES3_09060 [Steroidobacteraceae bacterium]
MNGRLQGFLDILDLLAEGQRRQAEVVTGRRFEPAVELQPAVTTSNVVKFPLTGHQKPRLFQAAPKSKVTYKH